MKMLWVRKFKHWDCGAYGEKTAEWTPGDLHEIVGRAFFCFCWTYFHRKLFYGNDVSNHSIACIYHQACSLNITSIIPHFALRNWHNLLWLEMTSLPKPCPCESARLPDSAIAPRLLRRADMERVLPGRRANGNSQAPRGCSLWKHPENQSEMECWLMRRCDNLTHRLSNTRYSMTTGLRNDSTSVSIILVCCVRPQVSQKLQNGDSAGQENISDCIPRCWMKHKNTSWQSFPSGPQPGIIISHPVVLLDMGQRTCS